MKKPNKIFSSVLEKIKPPQEEKLALDKSLLEFEAKLRPQLKKFGAKLFVGGSLAKQTIIKRDKDYDVDIFIMFPLARFKKKSQEISKILKQMLKAAKLKPITLKGSRDYFQCKFKGLKIELIPILAIKKASEALNITDVSPLHVFYILSKAKQKPGLNDEIRLAKAFCYSRDCYGAESYIRGFSGYALEVLVSHYGSFMKFIQKIAKWKIPTSFETKIVIDPAKHYKSKTKVFKEINEAKLHSPIILVDPVQRERNICAALNYKTFDKFIRACKVFLKKPSETFFFKQALDLEKLKKEARTKKAKFMVLKALSTKHKVDIAGAKLKKLYEFLFFNLKKKGFKILIGEFDFNEKTLDASFYLILHEPLKQYIVAGPPLNVDKKYILAFKRKWPKAFEQKGRLYAKAKREIASFKDFVAWLRKQKQLKAMGIKELKLVK